MMVNTIQKMCTSLLVFAPSIWPAQVKTFFLLSSMKKQNIILGIQLLKYLLYFLTIPADQYSWLYSEYRIQFLLQQLFERKRTFTFSSRVFQQFVSCFFVRYLQCALKLLLFKFYLKVIKIKCIFSFGHFVFAKTFISSFTNCFDFDCLKTANLY